MAQSKKPRKSYQRPDFRAQAAGLNPEKYGEQARAEQAGESQSAEQAHPESVPIDKEPVAPAHPHVTHRALRGRGRYLVPVAAGAGVVGGGAFLAHRARRRKAEMAKGLIDPTTGESVTFGKRYIDDEIDEKPRGALVAKTGIPKRAAVLMRAGQGASAVSRGAKATGRFVRSMEPPSKRKQGVMLGGATMYGFDRVTGGHSRRKAGREALRTEASDARMKRIYSQMDDLERGKKTLSPEDARKFGALEDKMVSRHQQRTGDQMRRNEYARAAKRYDESALEHTGSRRVGGRLPVSTVRTAGLPVQSATFSRGNPEARPGTRSHANKLTHVHTNVKAPRTGKLYQLHRRSRSKSGTSIGKSAGYAQSGGSGRRLVNV